MLQLAAIGSGLLLFRISDAVFGSVESPASFVDVRFFFDVHVFGSSSCSFCHPSER